VVVVKEIVRNLLQDQALRVASPVQEIRPAVKKFTGLTLRFSPGRKAIVNRMSGA
jgi:hypothetical protein